MKNQIIKNLKSLRKEIKLTAGQKSEVENFLMAKISPDLIIAKENKISIWEKLADRLIPANLAFKPVAVFSLILGLLLISAFSSANAAKDALPGDILYPVKITAENIKYNLAFSHEQKAKIAMEMVESGTDELKAIVQSKGDGEKKYKVAQVTRKIRESLDKVKDKIQIIAKEPANSKTTETVKDINKKLEKVKEEIAKANKTAGNKADDKLTQVIKEVEKTSKVVITVLKDKDKSNSNQAENFESQKQEESLVKGATTSTSSTSEQTLSQTASNLTQTTSEAVLPVSELLGIKKPAEKPQEFKVGIIK